MHERKHLRCLAVFISCLTKTASWTSRSQQTSKCKLEERRNFSVSRRFYVLAPLLDKMYSASTGRTRCPSSRMQLEDVSMKKNDLFNKLSTNIVWASLMGQALCQGVGIWWQMTSLLIRSPCITPGHPYLQLCLFCHGPSLVTLPYTPQLAPFSPCTALTQCNPNLSHLSTADNDWRRQSRLRSGPRHQREKLLPN